MTAIALLVCGMGGYVGSGRASGGERISQEEYRARKTK